MVRFAALLVALFTLLVGVVGLISPDSVTAVRRLYLGNSAGLYAAGAVRIAMGLAVIVCARASRAPKALLALGTVMCLQGLAAMLLGPERARAVLEWEAMQPALLRAGAAVALVAGGFLIFAVSGETARTRVSP